MGFKYHILHPCYYNASNPAGRQLAAPVGCAHSLHKLVKVTNKCHGLEFHHHKIRIKS